MKNKSMGAPKIGTRANESVRLREACLNAVEGEASLIFVEGHDDAILGVAERDGESFVVYNQAKVIRTLCRRDGMDRQGAIEFFEYNIAGTWMGERTPIFLTKV